ncbi:hypothetical protein [Demequina oxidasica]|nr:hypothetical protein [Demequina oxidasica]
MKSHDPASDSGFPAILPRHRVETPEAYETWREYAFSVEPEAEEHGLRN